MGAANAPERRPQSQSDIDTLADFVLMTQRSVMLGTSETLNKWNISFPQFFLLAYLASEEYLTMTDISKKMAHSTAATTGLIDRMEKLEYVERVHSDQDRRKIMVRITSKWVEFVAKMRLEITQALEKLLEDLESGKSATIWETRKALWELTERKVKTR